jgi:hypothetical protein
LATISGNTANTDFGGGIFNLGGGFLGGGALTIRNTTITGNSAAVSGGGIMSYYSAAIDLMSTIIAGNTVGASASASADLRGSNFSGIMQVNGNNNLIGVMDPANNVNLTGVGNLTGTKLSPLDAKIAPLANNGGLTKTHALLAGSPAFDKGNNVAAVTNDQRGTGFNRVMGSAADIGAFEIQAKPPTVMKIEVNDGSSIQCSMVTTIKVTFSEPVAFPSGIEAAFQLNRTGPLGPIGSINLNAVQAGSVVTITFLPGGAVGIDPAGSLQDGKYELTVDSDNVSGTGGLLDGNSDGNAVGNYTSPFHRLFGDANGDATVNSTDFAMFRTLFGLSGPSMFDFNGDSQTNSNDFAEFRKRFGITLVP